MQTIVRAWWVRAMRGSGAREMSREAGVLVTGRVTVVPQSKVASISRRLGGAARACPSMPDIRTHGGTPGCAVGWE